MKKYFRLAGFGVVFSTRAKGEQIGNALVDVLSELDENNTLVIEFSGVEAVSYSFMDQLLRQLILALPQSTKSNKTLAIAGWSMDLLPVVDKALERRNCQLSSAHSLGRTDERLLICHGG